MLESGIEPKFSSPCSPRKKKNLAIEICRRRKECFCQQYNYWHRCQSISSRGGNSPLLSSRTAMAATQEKKTHQIQIMPAGKLYRMASIILNVKGEG